MTTVRRLAIGPPRPEFSSLAKGELKVRLKKTILTVVGLVVVAVQAGANPIDTDNDQVFDDDDDCPNQKGPPEHRGCPVVTVYGTRESYSSVVCPDGSTRRYYSECVGYVSWTTYNLAFHDASTAVYVGPTVRVTKLESAYCPEGQYYRTASGDKNCYSRPSKPDCECGDAEEMARDGRAPSHSYAGWRCPVDFFCYKDAGAQVIHAFAPYACHASIAATGAVVCGGAAALAGAGAPLTGGVSVPAGMLACAVIADMAAEVLDVCPDISWVN